MPDPLTITSPAGVEVVSHGGLCPVQAYGTIGAFHWYFRARGGGWRLSVGGPDPRGQHYVAAESADLTVSGDYGGGYDAGYMPDVDVAERIGRALGLWQSGVRGSVEVEVPNLPYTEHHSLTPKDGLTRYIVVTEDGDLDGYVWADSEGAARVAAVDLGSEGDFTVTVDEDVVEVAGA